jgi:hypothetical protein
MRFSRIFLGALLLSTPYYENINAYTIGDIVAVGLTGAATYYYIVKPLCAADNTTLPLKEKGCLEDYHRGKYDLRLNNKANGPEIEAKLKNLTQKYAQCMCEANNIKYDADVIEYVLEKNRAKPICAADNTTLAKPICAADNTLPLKEKGCLEDYHREKYDLRLNNKANGPEIEAKLENLAQKYAQCMREANNTAIIAAYAIRFKNRIYAKHLKM